jgi:hypothetical protein
MMAAGVISGMNSLRDILEERHRSEIAKAVAEELRKSCMPEPELPPRLGELVARLHELRALAQR